MLQISQATCWVVTDGIPGVENQCLGLATALGVKPVIKRVKMRWLWKKFGPFWSCGLAHAFSPAGDRMTPPWPDLLIASGRQSVLASLYVRKMSRKGGGRGTFTVQIQAPGLAPSHFDLVITPRHDKLRGPNVMNPLGSLHRITPDLLAVEASKFAPRMAALPPRRLAVLIGGNNSVYQLSSARMREIAAQLVALARQGYGLMVTASRRTGAENLTILQQALADVPAFLWDGQGENPYFGMLGLAEAILVTGDSVNMVSEACATGKPVMVMELAGGSDKFARFHRAFAEAGLTRVFRGEVERWSPPPFNDVAQVADAVRRAYEVRA